MRKFYSLIVLMLCCVIAWGQETKQPVGEGTENSPYLVGTKEELYWIMENNKAEAEYPYYQPYWYVQLINDIDLNPGFTFNEDGTYVGKGEPQTWPFYKRYFKGTFDGNGHTIRGIYVHDKESLSGAFIGVNRTGTIKNLKLVNGAVKCADFVAGICSTNEKGGTIQNCYCDLFLCALDKDAANFFEGGMAGICSSSKGKIKNCTFAGTVKGWCEGNAGICAQNGDPDDDTPEAEISGCVNFGKVIAEELNDEDILMGSGICAFNEEGCPVTNSFYLEGTAPQDLSGSAMKTADEFASGEIVSLLNKALDEPVWGQRIGKDAYPVQLVFVPENERSSYKVYTLNLDYEDGESAVPFINNAGADLPTPEKEYFTFDGWYDAQEGGTRVSVVPADKETLYARWTPKQFTWDISSSVECTYKKEVSIDLSEELSENAETDCGEITFSILDDGQLPDGLTLEDGVIKGTPTRAHEAGVTVTIAANAAHVSVSKDINFKVCKAKLTVTPQADQILYKGEAPFYTSDKDGVIGKDDVTIEGTLAVDVNNQTIVIGFLELTGSAAANYELVVISNVSCTYTDMEPQYVELSDLPIDWQKEPVTLTAPAGFLISLTEKGEYTESLVYDAEGKGPFAYYLKRKEQTYEHSAIIQIDKTVPEVTIATNELAYTLTVTDALSGIASVTVDGTEVAIDATGSYTTTGTEGTHTVVVIDHAGNRTTKTFSLTGAVYTITLRQPTGGTISVDKREAKVGETITLSYDEHTDYDFDRWLVETEDGSSLRVEGNRFTMPAANVTVTARFDYDPYIPPTYYDLHIEENDSVRLDANKTTVREGGVFVITAEAMKGYDPATLVVEYKRGRYGNWRMLKQEASGKYRVTSVYDDIYLRARVERRDNPTALDRLEMAENRIRAIGNRLSITLVEPLEVRVVGMDGRLLRTVQLPVGHSDVWGLPSGTHIVLLSDGTRQKVAIR